MLNSFSLAFGPIGTVYLSLLGFGLLSVNTIVVFLHMVYYNHMVPYVIYYRAAANEVCGGEIPQTSVSILLLPLLKHNL